MLQTIMQTIMRSSHVVAVVAVVSVVAVVAVVAAVVMCV